jgi:hypothetical protein
VLAGKQGIILDADLTLFRCLSESSLYGSSENLNFDQGSRAVCSANCYTLAGLIFPGGSDHRDWEFIMWVYEGRVYP